MRQLKRLWEAIEERPAVLGVREAIRARLQTEYFAVESFLRSTGRRSETFPCPSPGGNGCPRRVIASGPGQFQAVCGCAPKECDTINVAEDDLIIHQFDWPKFCRFVAASLRLSGGLDQISDQTEIWDLGVYEEGNGPERVFLFAHTDSREFQSALDHLLACFPRPWTAITSRRRFASAATDERLAARNCRLIALDEIARIDTDGQLRIVEAAPQQRQTGPLPRPKYLFRRERGIWTITFEGTTIRLASLVGFEYIAELLRHPRTAIDAAILANRIGDKQPTLDALAHDDDRTKAEDRRRRPTPVHDRVAAAMAGIPMSDARAIHEVEAALAKNEAQLAQMGEDDASERSRLQHEIAELKKYLAEAVDIRGQAREVGGTTERARTRVTNAIGRALDRISAQHPALGDHLTQSLRTGATLAYMPAEVPNWQF